MSDIKFFENKHIRSVWNEEEQKWYFSIIDVCEVLTESPTPRRYWSDLKIQLLEEGVNELYGIIVQLKLQSSDGKKYNTDCANMEGLFRIIQSIPSKKAEPFKRWLAKVGYERLEEIEDPELAAQRAYERAYITYKNKGYDEDWIKTRFKSIQIRGSLTKEWHHRGIDKPNDFAVLTAEISKATFDMTPGEYKKFKSLDKPNENLRDHMNDLELVFTMLGEASTKEIAKVKNSVGFENNKVSAIEGGTVAGNARKNLEMITKKRVSTSNNFKNISINKTIE